MLLCSTSSYAQRINTDSAAKARKAVLDSTRAAQKIAFEETRAVRQKSLDSLKAVRKKTTDSLTAIRNYRNSKHYKDSVTHSREARMALIRNASKSRMDSIKAIRQHATDSMVAVRKATTDALKAKQKKRTDSLTAIRNYKNSKRFKDSVTIVRRVQTDSIKAARKVVTDALAAARKHSVDSAKSVRKAFTDSLTAVRKHRTDSLKAIQKTKADSLAKAKADKTKQKKATEKKKELDLSLKVELARKKKQEAWDNTKMLKKKWSAPRRLVQNTFTRYNYYFNANRKMQEARENMQRIGRDEYDKLLPLFSFDPSKDSSRFAADMDSVIQKASLGIQIHDPRAKWQDDLYLLLGEAYFYKGDFEQASNAFRYIVAQNEKMKADEAKKHAYSNRSVRGGRKEEPSVVTPEKHGVAAMIQHVPANNDALLWLSRTYVQSGKLDAAESVLDLLSADSKFPQGLKGRLALEKGYYDLAAQNYKDAANQLVVASNDKAQDWYTRRRAAYIAGQLLQNQGRYREAAAEYDMVTELNPKIDMDFYARKARAYNLINAGVQQDEAISSLRSMLNDNKYLPYHEQVYYTLGQLTVKSGNSALAEKYLTQSLATAKSTKKQRALTYATLGNVYYASANYPGAKRAYDSAAILGASIASDSLISIAIKRGKVLDKITVPANAIHVQDSLLELASLSEKEQRSAVRKYLRSLQRHQNDTSFSNTTNNNGPVIAAPQNDEVGTETTSWYFANPQLVQQGYTEFKRKWGNRPLTDNWRRSAAISQGGSVAGSTDGNVNNDGGTTGPGNGSGNNDVTGVNGGPTEESLLAAIPNSNAQKDIASRAVVRSYLDLSTAYVRQLEDYPRALHTLDTLNTRFPTHTEKAEETYLRYLIALRQNNLTKAQQYSNTLLQDYSTTKWAALVKPATEDAGGTVATAKGEASVSEYYEGTYMLMMQRDWASVVNRSRTGRQRYGNESYSNRFRIMEAMALAGQKDYGKADSLLTDFISTHPGDSLSNWASNVQAYVAGLKKADTVKPVATPAPPIPATTSRVDSTKMNVPASYTYKPSEAHYFVFLYPKSETRSAAVRAAMTDFNRLRFSSLSLSTTSEQLATGGGEGIVVTKGFASAAQAKVYMQRWKAEPSITREYSPGEYRTFIISASNFQKLMADKNSAAYLSFYQSHY